MHFRIGDSDVPPILFDPSALRRILLRALNRNQLLILSHLHNDSQGTITNILLKMSASSEIPLSTLKLNAKVLRQLDLVDFGSASNPQAVKLTKEGRTVLKIVSKGGEKHELP